MRDEEKFANMQDMIRNSITQQSLITEYIKQLNVLETRLNKVFDIVKNEFTIHFNNHSSYMTLKKAFSIIDKAEEKLYDLY